MTQVSAALLLAALIASTGLASASELDEAEVIELERAIEAGDRTAVVTLFNSSADGAAAEEIDIALGRVIRKDPLLFLQALSKSPRVGCERCLQALVGNLGDELTEKFILQLEELRQRRRALASVQQKDLRELRSKCLKALDADILEVEQAIKFQAGEKT